MDSIKKITKNVLTILKDNKLDTTPENYFKEFKKQSDNFNINIEELKLFDEIINTLTDEELINSSKLESFNDISKLLLKRVSDDDLKEFILVLNDILSPSIDFSSRKEIELFIQKLIVSPKTIVSKHTLQKLQSMTKNRISNDRQILREKTNDIVKITSLMEKYFEKSLIESSNSTKEIIKIKNELNELNISESSFRELGALQTKLVASIFNIENTLQKNFENLNDNKSKFGEMHKTIEKLQKELSIAKEEKATDFLTNILNRRAYNEEVQKIEKKHSIFDSKYVLIFMDIDHFKNINDSYGHTCGDMILKTFASILKELTRKEDIVCRYGGEEFVSLINYKNKDEIITYINRLKRIIKTNYFVYNDIRIHVRFSAGVAFRDKYKDYDSMKKSADDLLYEAKNKGRDKVIFDDGTEI